MTSLRIPKELKINVAWPRWELDLFGNGKVIHLITTDVPWSKRVATKLLLNSKWKNLRT